MSIMWGPALDAELEYRREQLLAADPPGRYRRSRAPHAPRLRLRRARRADAAATAKDTPADARRWVLPGSGAWHVAP